jgi:hypothetical protein
MRGDFKMSLETNMFKKFKLTEEEKHFIDEVDGALGVVNHNNFNMADKYKVLSNFYLAKQIEASSKSSGKQAIALNILTSVIIITYMIQIIISMYK